MIFILVGLGLACMASSGWGIAKCLFDDNLKTVVVIALAAFFGGFFIMGAFML